MKRFDFSAAAGPHPWLTEGWAAPEPGFTWTQGCHSAVTLPTPAGHGDLALEISLTPFRAPPSLWNQRLIVAVNGHVLPQENIGGECTLGWALPAALADAPALHITLHCPDAASPASRGTGADTRILGVAVAEMRLRRGAFASASAPRVMTPLMDGRLNLPDAVQALTGLTIAELGAYFENLGYDCAFGNAQRQMGVPAFSMLRYAGIAPHNLRRGLDEGFANVATPENLSIYLNDDGYAGEYLVRDAAYGMTLRTGIPRHQTDAESVLLRFRRTLQFLRRKFCEDLTEASKIYVFRHPDDVSRTAAVPVLNALRAHGPNTLLFVRGDTAQPSGTVHQVTPNLLEGWVAPFAGQGYTPRPNLEGWVSACANAYHLWLGNLHREK